MKYSIVVPLYNCENYIADCLKSLAAQDNTDFEVIVVNDGSTDGSLKIAEEFAEKYSYIRVISQTNKGLSGARNTGIREAKGEYIIFIDADDYVEPTLLSAVDPCIGSSELLLYGYYNDTYKDGILMSSFENVFTEDDISSCAKKMSPLTFSGMIGFAWNKVYKKSVITENGLWFREGTSLIEDILFNSLFFNATDKIGVCRKPLVHYIQRTGAETLSKKKYDNISELMTESFRCREDIFKRFVSDGYMSSVTAVFEFMMIFLLNYSSGNTKAVAASCKSFYESSKSSITMNCISNRLIRVLLKAKMFRLLALIYKIKNRLRTL